MQNWKKFDLSEVAKEMQICQMLSMTFPFFHNQTGLTPQFIFTCVEDSLVFDITFSPREPTEAEWNLLVQTILENEEFLNNQRMLLDIDRFENIAQLKYKLIEDIKIISKSRTDAYNHNK